MVNGLIDEFQIDGADVLIEYDTGMLYGGPYRVVVDGPDYHVSRCFHETEFNEKYARNFAKKIVRDQDYRGASINRTADWALAFDAYAEAMDDIYAEFSDRGLLSGVINGPNATEVKRRMRESNETLNGICDRLFEDAKTHYRRGHGDGNLDHVVEKHTRTAERNASALEER